ncbi:MAG: phosphotransferase [bacterium]|nr:phosphotransferase [bacterium]
MIQELNSLILKDWYDLPIDRKRPSSLSSIQISGRHVDFGKILLLIFAEGDRMPLFCGKVSRNSISKSEFDFIECEYKNLVFLNSLNSKILSKTIPKPIRYINLKGHSISLETAFVGTPMLNTKGYLFRRKIIQRHFTLALNWLLCFYRGIGINQIKFGSKEMDKHVNQPINYLRKIIPLTREKHNYLTKFSDQAKILHNRYLPLVPIHGDFTPNQILINRDNLCVIDWEFFQRDGLPFFDLINFLVSYGFLSNELSKKNRYWFEDRMKEHLVQYCSELNIDEQFLKIFLPLFLINKINLKYSQKRVENNRIISFLKDLLFHFLQRDF